MRKNLLFLLFIGICNTSWSQRVAQDTYWFFFSDKDNNGFSIGQPEQFLSQRSIDRRGWQHLPIDHSDTPVTQKYVDSLISLGTKVLFTSKWLNGALVQSSDLALIDTIDQLSFIGRMRWEPETDDLYFPPTPDGIRFAPPLDQAAGYKYGASFDQLNQLKLPFFHEKGYTGEGVLLAVLDAGFNKLPGLTSFQNAIAQDRIRASYDFVDSQTDVYHTHNHGTYVTSMIMGDWNDSLMGAAPDVDLLLARTENTRSETRIEEYSWIAGAEWADSIGADIFNTSLGYTAFDDPTTSYNYEDMDGETAHISIANGMTAAKGILSVTSAGNSGNVPWYYIGAPADAFNILSVGAVNAQKEISYFSSRGPSYDQRVKPEISALGWRAAFQNTGDSVSIGNGTSLSSPLIAGASALLWQAYPGLTASEIMQSVIASSDRLNNPDVEYGYGIPSFRAAYYAITGVENQDKLLRCKVYPNPFTDFIIIEIPGYSLIPGQLRVFDIMGRLMHHETIRASQSRFEFPGTLNKGIYLLEISYANERYINRIIKQ